MRIQKTPTKIQKNHKNSKMYKKGYGIINLLFIFIVYSLCIHYVFIMYYQYGRILSLKEPLRILRLAFTYCMYVEKSAVALITIYYKACNSSYYTIQTCVISFLFAKYYCVSNYVISRLMHYILIYH